MHLRTLLQLSLPPPPILRQRPRCQGLCIVFLSVKGQVCSLQAPHAVVFRAKPFPTHETLSNSLAPAFAGLAFVKQLVYPRNGLTPSMYCNGRLAGLWPESAPLVHHADWLHEEAQASTGVSVYTCSVLHYVMGNEVVFMM